MGELLPGVSYGEFLEAARACSTESGFRASRFHALHGAALEQLLLEPRIEQSGSCDSPPPDGVLRIVQWNIEKGKSLPELKTAFRDDPCLQNAHIFCLNEVDKGTARSGGNADVAADIAGAVGCGLAYVPTYIECTKGVGDERSAPGENALGLHGLAVISRMPILKAAAVPLPSCFDYFGFDEKRYGGRRVLMVLVEWNSVPVLVGTTHLEVRNTPLCRARQMRAVLDAVADARQDWGARAVILTGDWNTHTFGRGGFLHAAAGYLRIARTRPEELEEQLLRPFRREPLLGLAASAGLQVEPFNDGQPTARETLGRVEEWDSLPSLLRTLIRRTGSVAGRTLPLRLDWIAADGATAASPPWTRWILSGSGAPLSDHAAIGAGLHIIQPGGHHQAGGRGQAAF